MAQAGYTPIKLYYSATASAVPTAGNLADGELALNITDGKLFYKDNLGAVQTLASKNDLTTISFGTTGLTPSTATGGAVTVAGTLATTNGGTGLTSFNANGAVYATSSSALTTGTLPTTGGGTGLSSFTANRVFYASSTSAIAQSANLTFDGTTLTAANFTDSSLTSGRVTYATTGGNLTDSANFTFDGSNLQIGSQGDLRFGDSDNSNWVAFQSPATVASNVTWTLPSTDGTNGQALTTNGSGTLAWSTVAGAPGGSNTQIQYNNAGAFAGASGLVTDGSNLTLNAQGDLRFADSDSSNWVAFQAPATISSNVTWTLPNADGTSGQFLSTDGSGTLSWATASGGGGGGGTSTTTTQVTATGGQTTFNVTYTVGQVSVYLNGALLAAADYTATNGTTVVLTTGATAGDIFTAVVYSSVTAISQGNTNVTVSDSGSNGTITFTTEGSERMRITSAGDVGIGTNSPSYKLHVSGSGNQTAAVASSSSNAVLRLTSSGGFDQIIEYTTVSTAGLAIKDATAGVNRVYIDNNGNITFRNNISVGNATPTTSGTGITFPATQSASSNANTLDDYEEGTWTPATAISSLTTAYAIYTKIGRFVCLAFDITIAANASTTGISITGVPFAANSSGSFTGTLIADNFNVLNVNPFINAATTTVGFMISSTTGGGRNTVAYSQVNASGVLRAVVCYMTD